MGPMIAVSRGTSQLFRHLTRILLEFISILSIVAQRCGNTCGSSLSGSSTGILTGYRST